MRQMVMELLDVVTRREFRREPGLSEEIRRLLIEIGRENLRLDLEQPVVKRGRPARTEA